MADFVQESQDKTRNALEKSLKAAYGAWEEQLAGDQAKFQAALIALLAWKS